MTSRSCAPGQVYYSQRLNARLFDWLQPSAAPFMRPRIGSCIRLEEHAWNVQKIRADVRSYAGRPRQRATARSLRILLRDLLERAR